VISDCRKGVGRYLDLGQSQIRVLYFLQWWKSTETNSTSIVNCEDPRLSLNKREDVFGIIDIGAAD
jgi:hypothetical protein